MKSTIMSIATKRREMLRKVTVGVVSAAMLITVNGGLSDLLTIRTAQAIIPTSQAGAPTPDANGNCTGINTLTGGTMTQPGAVVNNKRVCYGVYAAGTVNPYTGQVLKADCKIGKAVTGYSGIANRLIDPLIQDCSKAGLPTALKAASSIYPQTGRGVAGEGARMVRGTCIYTRIFWNQDGTTTLKAIDGCPGQGVGGGLTPGQVITLPISDDPIGQIEVANKTTISGWAMDLNDLTNTFTSLRIYRRAKVGDTPVLVDIQPPIVANKSRPDLITTLSLPDAENAGKHGFSFATPNEFKEGERVIIYAVNTGGAWNPSIGEKEIGSPDTPTKPMKVYLTATADGNGNLPAGNGVQGRATPPPAPGSSNQNYVAPPRTAAGIIASCAGVARCYIATGDGGSSCALTERGITAEEIELCRARVEACIGNDNRLIFGFCDPGRYTACRANPEYVDAAGRIDTAKCDEALQEGCDLNPGDPNIQDKARACDPECIINNRCATPPPPPTTTPPPPAATPPPPTTTPPPPAATPPPPAATPPPPAPTPPPPAT